MAFPKKDDADKKVTAGISLKRDMLDRLTKEAGGIGKRSQFLEEIIEFFYAHKDAGLITEDQGKYVIKKKKKTLAKKNNRPSSPIYRSDPFMRVWLNHQLETPSDWPSQLQIQFEEDKK